MKTIGLLGDTHMNLAWVKFALKAFKHLGVDAVLQVGDFGLYWDRRGREFLETVSGYAKNKYGITLYVIPGNHENWRYINETVGSASDWVEFAPNVMVAPRVHRWEWGGTSFVSLSGAPSVERTWRESRDAMRRAKVGADGPDTDAFWYPEEAVTAKNVEDVIRGGYADVMVGHDAPSGILGIERVIKGNPHGFQPHDLHYAALGRALTTQAFEGVAPRFYIHGHYHVAVNEKIPRPGLPDAETHVIGLNRDTMNYSLGLLHTKAYHGTEEATLINHKALLQAYRDGTL